MDTAFPAGSVPLVWTRILGELKVGGPVARLLGAAENHGYHIVICRNECLCVLNGVKHAVTGILPWLQTPITVTVGGYRDRQRNDDRPRRRMPTKI